MTSVDDHMGGNYRLHTSKEEKRDFVEELRWLLPVMAASAFMADAFWSSYASMTRYAGLPSTIMLVFYFLCYDHGLNHGTIQYIAFFTYLLVCMVVGDVMYTLQSISYFDHCDDCHPTSFTVVMILWTIIDAAFVICVAIFRWPGGVPLVPFRRQAIFMLIARTEIIFAIFVPLYSSTKMVPSNIIAFFLLFEVFGHHYDELTGHLQRVFWLFALLAVVSALCEWVHIASAGNAEDDASSHHEDSAFHVSLFAEFATGCTIYYLIIRLCMTTSHTQDDTTGLRLSHTVQNHIGTSASQHVEK
jgi:hypothetical protein